MCRTSDVVMAGLVPAIHVFGAAQSKQDVDARAKPGHDGGEDGASTPEDRILACR
jgi:hypothetical protein